MKTDEPVITQQNIVASESNTKTVIGLNALMLPTPDRVKAIFKMITFFTVLATIVLNGISTIPPDIKKYCSEWVLVIILALQKAEDFFGIQVDK